MDELSDIELLQEFAASESERAFEALVSRYLNLVYSTALRRVSDPHLAQDITQAVFIILAQKAKTLSRKVILPGWLYRTTLFAASDVLKSNFRRKHREQEMAMLNQEADQNDPCWELLMPHLDEAMEKLSEKDRAAVLLRFFEKRSYREVAEALGTTEDAAQKRVTRAIDQLKFLLGKRSIRFSAATLGLMLTQWSVQAAPAGLALSTVHAVSNVASTSASVLTIIKGTLKTLMWEKAKMAILISAPLFLALGVHLAVPASLDPIPVQLGWMESGVNEKLNPGSLFPFEPITLTADQPEGLVNIPAGVMQPQFGEFQFGPKENRRRIYVLIDEPEGSFSRLWVDQNGNLDLTDDPIPDWQYQGGMNPYYSGQVHLTPGPEGNTNRWSLKLWRLARNHPHFSLGNNSALLMYCRDYARTGQIILNEKPVNVMLDDRDASGDFRDASIAESTRVLLYLDLNGDGKFYERGEKFSISKPFSVGGRSYQIVDVTPDGHRFTLAQSSSNVPEVPILPDYVEGDIVPSFTRSTIADKKVKFPSDYKGKLLLLDFWATWCSPCIAEIPHLRAAHSKFHKQGFEILGIALEQPGSELSFREFLRRHAVTWPQVHCSKMWEDDLVKHLGASGIPHSLLIDGDTGEIVAVSNNLRGELLAGTVERFLIKKRGLK